MLEFLQINNWIKENNQHHVEICSKFEQLEAKQKAEKKQKVEGYEEDYEDSQMHDRE